MIIDDPFKNRKEAESDAYRRDVWEWWTSTARTRLEDGGAVIGMFTRWHADDWAGRLLRNMVSNPKAERWTPMTLMAVWESVDSGQWAVGSEEGAGLRPARTFEEYQREQLLNGSWVEREDPLGRKAGEALWPEKYNAEDLAMIREAVGPYDWEALYQQRPYSRQGNMFRREWFAIVEEGPKEAVVRVRAWDKAGTAGGGAFTSGVCMSRTVNGLIYVEHVVRGQWSQFQREEEMLHTARLDGEMRTGATVIWHPQDPGSAGKDSAQSTNEKMANAGFEAHFEPVTGDKEVRAGPWSSALEAGIVRLVRGGWNEAFIEEHVAFPMSRFKDQVDASSDAYEKVRVGDPYGGIHV
jgi:predicted phage terminase large subunit-like protein